MILQALVRHYEDLAAQGVLDRPGWSRTGIPYALYINDAGDLEQVVSLKREEERGKREYWSPGPCPCPPRCSGRSGSHPIICGTTPVICWAWMRRESPGGAWSALTPARRFTTGFWPARTARRPGRCWRFLTAGSQKEPEGTPPWRTRPQVRAPVTLFGPRIFRSYN